MNKTLIGVGLAIAAIAIAFLMFSSGSDEAAETTPAVAATGADPAVEASTVEANSAPTATPEPVEPATTTPAHPAPARSIVLAQADPAPAAKARRFELGRHYQRLTPTQPTSSSPDKVEVAEVFWYGCSHCYTFDPYIERWKPGLAENVSFVRIPAVWNPLVRLHAQAFYTAAYLGKEEEMHTAFFREIHVNNNTLASKDALEEFFGRFGVSKKDFNEAFDSFDVNRKLQQADTLARRYRVTSVPVVVINGKYTSNAGMTNGYDTLLEVVDELVDMETEDSST